MTYSIKTYEEGFIEQQVDLGNKLTENWTGYNMASKESLQDAYSQENFDPETRLYAFKNGEMVGFLTSYVAENNDGEKEAHYRLPIISEDHNEAAKLLIDKSIEILKQKGTKRILTSFIDEWGNFTEYASNYNFNVTGDGNAFSEISVDHIKVPDISSDLTIEELDPEIHKQALIHIFREGFGLDQETAENNFNLISSFDKQLIITHSAIFSEGKIIGRTLLYKPNSNSEFAYLGNIYAVQDKEELIFDLFVKHIVKKSREKGVETINKPILGDKLKIANYEKYGFSFDYVYKSYVKEL